MSRLKDNTPGNRIVQYRIHGQTIEMELSDFNRAFSEDTNDQRLTFGRPGTFKMLYSPSTDHESMCYYPKLKIGKIMETSMIKDLQLHYPRKVPTLVKLRFKMKCWFDNWMDSF